MDKIISMLTEIPKHPIYKDFQQQKLPTWRPIYKLKAMIPIFFIVGIIFIGLGLGILIAIHKVQEFKYDYTYCTNIDNSTGLAGKKCSDILIKNSTYVCKCKINFVLKKDFIPNVYMYYGLNNFYQNHRFYTDSRDDYQLLGYLDNSPSIDCYPFSVINNKPIVPCGAIANSLFTDELSIYSIKLNKSVPLLNKGIAWPTDKTIKFNNPIGNLSIIYKNYSKPIAWKKTIYELDSNDNTNNGFINEDFIVWMRTAALPTFRKLYRRVNHSDIDFKNGLSHGKYELHINYTYQVTSFYGNKYMILSNTSKFGVKNYFLWIAYIIFGTITLILAIIFLYIHINYRVDHQ